MKITGETFRSNGPCSITIEVQGPEDLDKIKAGVMGVRWMAGTGDGRVDTREIFEPVKLVPDPVVGPHFEPTDQTSYVSYQHYSRPSKYGVYDPAIYVQHIAGYGGNYEEAAVVMESVGFECLRSRRGPSGQYWEVWFLPGGWWAKGPIAGKKTDEICAWLRSTVLPGTIEIGGEHWGLGID